MTDVRSASGSVMSDGRTRTPSQPMWTTVLAWGAWLAALGGGLVGFVLAAEAASRPGGYQQEPLATLTTVVPVVAYGSVGLILRIRRPDHSMGWLFLAISLTAAGSNLSWGLMARQSESPAQPDEAWLIAALLWSVVLVTAWAVLLVTLILIFPDGRPASARERRLLRAAILGAPILALGILVRPGPMIGIPAFENPLLPSDGATAIVFVAAFLWQAGIATLALAAMARRYRTGTNELRHQVRWFAFGAGAAIAAAIVYIGTGLVVPTSEIGIWSVTYILWSLSVAVLPIAVLFAITRHRLYDIDRILGRAFVIGTMTAILAGLFAASMRLLEAVFVALTGEESDLVLVLTTLLLTTTFTPIKSRLDKIPRRWFRDEKTAIGSTVAAVPAGGAAGSEMTTDDLDARIERIARRVSAEALASARSAGAEDVPPEPMARSDEVDPG